MKFPMAWSSLLCRLPHVSPLFPAKWDISRDQVSLSYILCLNKNFEWISIGNDKVSQKMEIKYLGILISNKLSYQLFTKKNRSNNKKTPETNTGNSGKKYILQFNTHYLTVAWGTATQQWLYPLRALQNTSIKNILSVACKYSHATKSRQSNSTCNLVVI